MASTKPTSTEPGFDFGKKLQRLEEITASFEQEGVDLDKGLAQFDDGMKLVAELRQYLEQAVGRVEQIKQKYEAPANEGEATLPF
jgi:exodeoxyribonuclease VII small subunit